jgi:hypothetical protein
LDGLPAALLLEFVGALAVILEETLARERPLDPVQELRRGIDLTIVLSLREHRHLVQIFGEPWRGLWDVDKAVLDDRGLRIQAHDLVGGRQIARDAVAAISDQLLDQLGARSLVLDQHLGRVIEVLRNGRANPWEHDR